MEYLVNKFNRVIPLFYWLSGVFFGFAFVDTFREGDSLAIVWFFFGVVALMFAVLMETEG